MLFTYMEKHKIIQALNGATIFSIVGCIWASYGSVALESPLRLGVALMLILVALYLVRMIFFLKQKLSLLPAENIDPKVQKRLDWEGKMFGIVNAVQGVAIFLAVQVCNNLHFPEYFLPVVALIVGLHFVALAPVLRTSFHLALGTVMCLLAVVTMVVVPKPLWAVVLGDRKSVV